MIAALIVAIILCCIFVAVICDKDVEIHQLRNQVDLWRSKAGAERERAEVAERQVVIARGRGAEAVSAIETITEIVKGLEP